MSPLAPPTTLKYQLFSAQRSPPRAKFIPTQAECFQDAWRTKMFAEYGRFEV